MHTRHATCSPSCSDRMQIIATGRVSGRSPSRRALPKCHRALTRSTYSTIMIAHRTAIFRPPRRSGGRIAGRERRRIAAADRRASGGPGRPGRGCAPWQHRGRSAGGPRWRCARLRWLRPPRAAPAPEAKRDAVGRAPAPSSAALASPSPLATWNPKLFTTVARSQAPAPTLPLCSETGSLRTTWTPRSVRRRLRGASSSRLVDDLAGSPPPWNRAVARGGDDLRLEAR